MHVYQICTMDSYLEEDHSDCLEALCAGNALYATLAGAKQACEQDARDSYADNAEPTDEPYAPLTWEQSDDGLAWEAVSPFSATTYIIRQTEVK